MIVYLAWFDEHPEELLGVYIDKQRAIDFVMKHGIPDVPVVRDVIERRAVIVANDAGKTVEIETRRLYTDTDRWVYFGRVTEEEVVE